MTVQDLINQRRDIRGAKVRFVGASYVFHGEVSYQREDGMVVAIGSSEEIVAHATDFEILELEGE